MGAVPEHAALEWIVVELFGHGMGRIRRYGEELRTARRPLALDPVRPERAPFLLCVDRREDDAEHEATQGAIFRRDDLLVAVEHAPEPIATEQAQPVTA